jgi:hypothetical protein
MRRIFAGIMDDLRFTEAKHGEGRIRATLAITDDEDASAIAHRTSTSTLIYMARYTTIIEAGHDQSADKLV